MGDSDDDYDRRRRDKFRRERSDYGREDRRGRDWARDRGPRDFSNRGGYVDRRRERFSPPRGDTNISPPPKRMRRDWDDVGAGPVGVAGGGYYEGGGGYGNYQHTWSGQPEYQQRPQREMGDSSQIPLMSFKQFVLAQEDDVDDEIAVQRYKDYKIEHRRQQLSEFFVAHKDEEWFKVKYHPEDSTRRQEEVFAGVRNRLQAFMYLLETKWLESIMLDIDKPDDIIRLLDAAVIKMEGGTDTDLKILDMESEDEEEGEKASEESSSSEEEEEEDEEEKKKKGSTGHPEEPAKVKDGNGHDIKRKRIAEKG
ncbi:PREDICTED: serrate RNA effector molecule homolog [Priapulus caudatus]|uniref:Serrate RNA effector molecule homolog n=1 Tax=Priapulus caudatus TaxID=37621 RepID=A0ABM1EZP1_PRICU|nr:PREDICTED: serrate RNA effector molecule homolog [Priapulus caudatus]